jgi:hypothetical protein
MAGLLGAGEWAGKIYSGAGSTRAVIHSQRLSRRQGGSSPRSVRRPSMTCAGRFSAGRCAARLGGDAVSIGIGLDRSLDAPTGHPAG